MKTLPSISIITTCKGRLAHLKQSLPAMLRQDYPGEVEVVVVDYGCPEGAAAFVRSLRDPRARCVEVRDNVDEFNMSRARNVGAAHATGDLLAFVDADCCPRPEYLTAGVMRLHETHALLCCPAHPDGSVFGSCLLDESVHRSLRGYDESFTGWGYDDIDYYARLAAKGGRVCNIPADLIDFIYHDADARVTHFASKETYPNADRNAAIGEDRLRTVNPAGYGLTTDYQLHGLPRSLHQLRQRHPWPLVKPDLGHNGHGWLGQGNSRLLEQLLREVQPQLIVEVGTWLGLSARYMLDLSPAHVIAVDLWPDNYALDVAGITSGILIDHVVSTNWLYQERLTLLRKLSVDGLQEIASAGLSPDLIYIDASHERSYFMADLESASRLFPGAVLCGDDWSWFDELGRTIQPAVDRLAATRNQRVEVDGECWLVR